MKLAVCDHFAYYIFDNACHPVAAKFIGRLRATCVVQNCINNQFIFVEGDLGEYVFDTLKEEYAGHILLNPNADMYHQYWADDMLVIKKLITEAPKGTDEFWHTDLEKMLVDIVSDKLLRSCVNQGEYKTIFTQAFKDFYIDESQLFRYARRRNAKAKVLEQIDKSLLRTE